MNDASGHLATRNPFDLSGGPLCHPPAGADNRHSGLGGGTPHAILGPDGFLGGPLKRIGLHVVHNDLVAWAIGLVLVLAGIWLLGLLMKSVARQRIESMANAVVKRIPIVSSVYGTVSQLMGMLKQDSQGQLGGMSVVFCSFGQQPAAAASACWHRPKCIAWPRKTIICSTCPPRRFPCRVRCCLFPSRA